MTATISSVYDSPRPSPEPILKELPMEYAVGMNRLIEINMAAAGAVG